MTQTSGHLGSPVQALGVSSIALLGGWSAVKKLVERPVLASPIISK